jgi:SAM-dependent methyltransferase
MTSALGATSRRTAYLWVLDTLKLAFPFRRWSLVPPESMFADPDRVDGSRSAREFLTVGREVFQWLVEVEGLRPAHRFLDVGCGIGRMAVPLTAYLGESGYHGLEISAEKVAYCRRTVGRKRPDFAFHHADVFNKYYNPGGRVQASEYRFPFDDGSFDFVFLSSVFTHMLPADMEHYLAEIARVLGPGGRCAISYWLADEKKGPPYHSISADCEILSPEEPEHGVAYREGFVTELYRQHGLRIERLSRGADRRRPDSHPSRRQDLIVAVKPGRQAPPFVPRG